tara:strand:+ start:771 stop:1712 length:942 start_codon:yes stop_codon:yes gene_type:complete
MIIKPLKRKIRLLVFLLIVSLIFPSCLPDTNPNPIEGNPLGVYGSGSFSFNGYVNFQDKPVNCYYFIPESATDQTPIMFLIHGNGRNAQSLLASLKTSAESSNVILIAPELSTQYFNFNAFGLCNVFQDGENASGLNEYGDWSFNLLDPIFYDFNSLIESNQSEYDLFGFSAGAQFVHRMTLLDSTSHVRNFISASAGWYTLPDTTINFPYGLKNIHGSQTQRQEQLFRSFSKKHFIIVGSEDNDPNSSDLRHTLEADAQGSNRYDRAHYFLAQGTSISDQSQIPFSWNLQVVSQVGHSGQGMGSYAINMLYP